MTSIPFRMMLYVRIGSAPENGGLEEEEEEEEEADKEEEEERSLLLQRYTSECMSYVVQKVLVM